MEVNLSFEIMTYNNGLDERWNEWINTIPNLALLRENHFNTLVGVGYKYTLFDKNWQPVNEIPGIDELAHLAIDSIKLGKPMPSHLGAYVQRGDAFLIRSEKNRDYMIAMRLYERD